MARYCTAPVLLWHRVGVSCLQVDSIDGGPFSPETPHAQETLELQRQLGANVDVDVAYQYLRFFLEDDEELETIRVDYAAGRLLTGEVKGRLIAVLNEMVGEHQARRAAVTDDVVAEFMAVRPLDF